MTDRDRILARRAKFMLAALATVGATTGACKESETTTPQAVPNEVKTKKDTKEANDAGLSSTIDEQKPDPSPPDAPEPMPCLKIAMPRDAGAPVPKPCLSMAYPADVGPPPMPCLSPMPPKKGDDSP